MSALLYGALTLLLAGGLIWIDQAIKAWATTVLQPVQRMILLPGIMDFEFTLNDGAAFSMLSGKQTFLQIFTGIALAGVLAYLLIKRPPNKLEYFAWVLILSGGLGNFFDRIRNGVVVDYIHLLFVNFAVFNFADIMVCTGVGLLILAFILEELKKKNQKDA